MQRRHLKGSFEPLTGGYISDLPGMPHRLCIRQIRFLLRYQSLSKAMHQIVEGEINVEYMYAFANGADAAAVLKSDDPARVIDILKGSGFDV